MLGVSVAFQRLALRGRKFTIASLFASGQNEFLRASDQLVYSDTAATTPATLEEAVAAWGDLSPNANLAVQATSTARGVLSGRYNLLQFTEQFDNAAWMKINASVTANSTTDPQGGSDADTLVAASTGQFRYAHQLKSLVIGEAYRLIFYAKYDSCQYVWLLGETDRDTFFWFDIQNGVLGGSGTSIGAPISGKTYSHSIEDAGGGWYKCTANFTITSATSSQQVGIGLADNNNNVSATSGVAAFIWGASLTTVDENTASLPPYQRVGNLTADPDDYDTVGFPSYVRMDAFDDVYPQTIDAVTGGTVILATSQGIWIDTLDASAGTWSLGPTAYTGGPSGLLTALKSGDHVKVYGYGVLDYAISASQRAGIVQYYRNRGAGPELELGPELVVNGTFDTDLSGWVQAVGLNSATWDSGTALIAHNGSSPCGLFADQSVTAGGNYLFTFAWSAFSDNPNTRIYNGAAFTSVLYQRQAGTDSGQAIVSPTLSATRIYTFADTAGKSVNWDSTSLRKLQVKS